MGLGVFAKCDLNRGDLLFQERPLLASPTGILNLKTRAIPSISKLSYSVQKELQLAEMDKLDEKAVQRVSNEDQDAFMALANSHTHDGSGKSIGIPRTNGFGIASLRDVDPVLAQLRLNRYSTVYKVGSRVNHSCIRNIKGDFFLA
ncbi:hypothetical protein CPB83DRAFT_584590 [Crepidotus variabilis]|uniref:Uncharacterized protein n=1 Tax=Crepidotus variabilis TaxID=179855 RepID=A0A9P6EN58_9AGAR|nr:hypothetical protein CPB83DRAFT_584590 [Crepidotus variabilis]